MYPTLLHFDFHEPTQTRADPSRILQRQRYTARWAGHSLKVALWLLDAQSALLIFADGIRIIDGLPHLSKKLAQLAGVDYTGDILAILTTLRAIVIVNHALEGSRRHET